MDDIRRVASSWKQFLACMHMRRLCGMAVLPNDVVCGIYAYTLGPALHDECERRYAATPPKPPRRGWCNHNSGSCYCGVAHDLAVLRWELERVKLKKLQTLRKRYSRWSPTAVATPLGVATSPKHL